MTPVTAYIALGPNLGQRDKTIAGAIAKLRNTPGVEVARVSSLLENPSVGGPEGAPSFLNAAAELRTTLGAHTLLHRLLEIERELGRARRDKWEPRIIDLDLLFHGDHILSSQELIVPHPLMHERRFVVPPPAGNAPGVGHPTPQISISGLREAFGGG